AALHGQCQQHGSGLSEDQHYVLAIAMEEMYGPEGMARGLSEISDARLRSALDRIYKYEYAPVDEAHPLQKIAADFHGLNLVDHAFSMEALAGFRDRAYAPETFYFIEEMLKVCPNYVDCVSDLPNNQQAQLPSTMMKGFVTAAGGQLDGLEVQVIVLGGKYHPEVELRMVFEGRAYAIRPENGENFYRDVAWGLNEVLAAAGSSDFFFRVASWRSSEGSFIFAEPGCLLTFAARHKLRVYR
ncbi:MAG: hypothetical protein AAF570_27855, partial [Bacteroidota bacterium]